MNGITLKSIFSSFKTISLSGEKFPLKNSPFVQGPRNTPEDGFIKDIDKAILEKLQATLDLEKINRTLEMIQTRISVEKDLTSGKMVFKIVNAETGETIKQIPPETMLKISAHIAEYINSAKQEHSKGLLNKTI